MRFAFVLIVLVALGGILFATQPTNTEEIRFVVPFINTTIVGYKLWTVLGAWVLGLVLGYLAAVPGSFSAKRRAKKVEKQLAAVQAKAGETVGEARAAADLATVPAAKEAATEAADDAAEIERLASQVARSTEHLK
ncbi:MAG: hypothetical protein AAF791_06415 [Bacteroidota bacterium]